ncbi:MAG: cytochrome b N-terminal domain-containing protein [Chlorobium sp.]|nr:cytochrome b N-terminal domain-containing protein [Chlorobium sp.]MCW8820305.1 cytochrome b N-terminal domain-containing protein [Ignavibacteriaceae bacterium]
MAEENKNIQTPASKPSAPGKPEPPAAKPSAPGASKPPAAKSGAPAKVKPAAVKQDAGKKGVYKPPVQRAEANPFKDTKTGAVVGWLEERFAVLIPVIAYLRKKEVPKHRLSFWYYFGGLAMFFFMIQILTGLLLMLYYRPTEAEAFARFVYIQTEVPFGWLIRQVHAWSANLMVLMAFIHMFSTFFMKAYRKPRELMWVSGFILLVLTLGFGFTGYLLPWNELAYFATQIGTEVPKVAPGGEFIVRLLRGGEEVGGETLTRMFAMHVILLPGLVMLFLSAHLMLVQVLGTSSPIGYKEAGLIKGYEKFFPTFLAKDGVAWLIGFALLIYLAVMFPWETGEKVDMLAAAPDGIKPEWYFWAQFQLLKDLKFEGGELLAIVILTVGAIIWILVPFMDRKASREERSPLFTIFGLLVLAFLLIGTFRVYLEYGW